MSTSALAPRHDPGSNHAVASDPFATPTLDPCELPAMPEPAAQSNLNSRSSSRRYIDPGRPPLGLLQHDQAAYPYKSASMSSSGDSSSMTPISSIDLEKSAGLEREAESRKKQRTSRDPEKAVHSPERGGLGDRDRRRSNTSRVSYSEDDDDRYDSRRIQEEKALKILLFLAMPCVVLSFLNLIWTLISLAVTAMTQPVRLCARRPSFGQQLGGLVGPALNLQLKSIHTPLPPHADEDSSYSTGMLMVVMLLSPFLSLGMMLAAWVSAVFWISSAVVGDPAGMDKRDDGRETVLALRDWWERWLVRSMREE